MPKPSARDIHVNAPLTNISIAYIQNAQNFVADRVFPMIPVLKQSDRYFEYKREDWFRIEAQLRGPATESAGSGFNVDNTPTYFANVFAVHKDVDDQTRANADSPINLDRDATEYVTQQLLLKREKTWALNNFTTGVWGTDLTGVASAPAAGQFLQWNDSASTPIEDVTEAGVEIAAKTGFRPNTLVLSPRVFNTLKNHPDVLDRIKYTQRGVVTADILAGLFEVDRVLVPWGVENSADEGLTGNFNFIFGKGALLAYANPRPSILQPSAGYTFTWNGLLGAGAAGNRIRSFRMEHLSADRIEGEMSYDQKVVAPDLATFFADAIA